MDNTQSKQQTNKTLAVLTADVHYNINTLKVADAAMNLAIEKANELQVPLIVAGDLHDSKAHMRGECVAAMLKTFSKCVITPIILVGNHCKIHEKSETHSLEFLRHIATIVDKPVKNLIPYWCFMPYQHDTKVIKDYLETVKCKNVIMHQGIAGSYSGEYIQDRTALKQEDLAGFRVISGHYHRRQTIKLPNNGTFDYVGNPYTLTFSETNDPDKGFQILYDDGSLEFIPTYLRRHKVIEVTEKNLGTFGISHQTTSDLYWIKAKGSREWLSTLSKDTIEKELGICGWSFKLDLIPTETNSTLSEENVNNSSHPELLDNLIDSMTNLEQDQKTRLKTIWKDLL